MESIWIMARSTASAGSSAALFSGPARPRRSSRKRRSSVALTSRISTGLVTDPGLREARHAVMAGDRRAQHGDRERRARSLAQAHAEIEQGLLAQALCQAAMAGLGGAMGDQAMIEGAGHGGLQQ